MPRHATSPSFQDIVDQSQDRNLPLPVHGLPPEILGIIFTMLDETWLQPSDADMPPVLAVSRTCRRWRQISLSLPSLWSFIAIHLMESDPPDYHQLTLLTRLFADRSKKHPLRLLLRFDKIFSLDGKEGTVVPILRTLVQHSERWHAVEFHTITRAVLSHQVLSPISGRLPMLANLALYAQGGEEDRPLDSSSCDLFSNCPSLTCVSLTPGRLFSGPFTNHYPLACGQIKALDVYFTEISAALKIATLGTSIEQLALCYCNGDSSSLLLPGVTHLSVAAMEAGEAYCPFKHLTLQGLSSLEITRGPGYDDDGEDWEAWNEEPIRDFFERSGCTVTSLSLRGVPISDEQLIHLLRLMPALSSLCLQEFSGDVAVNPNRVVTRRLLQKLTIDDTSSSPFLPKLTDISLVLREDGLADTVLPNAVISRWFPDGSQSEVACIKSVDVVFVNESEETIEVLTSKLRLLKESGVWVSVGRVQAVAEG